MIVLLIVISIAVVAGSIVFKSNLEKKRQRRRTQHFHILNPWSSPPISTHASIHGGHES